MDEPHDRNVYILGAGFSADAGAPLIHNFLDRSLGFLLNPTTGLDEIERGQFEAVFKFRQEVAQAREKVVLDLDNIEQLFGLIEISERLRRSNDLRTSMQYLIVKTLQLATWGTRRSRIRFTATPGAEIFGRIGDGHPGFAREEGFKDTFSCDVYTFFASLVTGFVDSERERKGRRDSIITFNYDLVLEHALQRIGAVADYHLPGPMVKEPCRDTPRVTVLKLHGSANWAICTNCEGSVIVLDEKVTENPNALRETICPDCQKASYHPLLIPPSWDKSEYQRITSAIWRQAVAELEKATRIIVIGYSMPEVDAFFKYLMTLSLSRNHSLFKFIVVDLDRGMPLTDDEERTEPRRLLQRKYAELLDPLFYRRRFHIDLSGFSRFMSMSACGMLGRGDALTVTGLF